MAYIYKHALSTNVSMQVQLAHAWGQDLAESLSPELLWHWHPALGVNLHQSIN